MIVLSSVVACVASAESACANCSPRVAQSKPAAAVLERVILQGVEALRIIDYRHDALGQRACVVEHEKVGAGAATAFPRSNHRAPRSERG